MEHDHPNQLKVKPIGIDTYRKNIIYMRHDCFVSGRLLEMAGKTSATNSYQNGFFNS
jgi:hypothetical protein